MSRRTDARAVVYPSSPPAQDLSRSRLKALTHWIRDELDLLVAREGPNVLRPDDVLTLHDTLTQLRLATTITVQDLRSTGIHRAILDIAGVATRWPGRLCDDCDRIIAQWTEKYGPLTDIKPFLYGRGGRLEGIASAAEHSREALLKRWAETCPEKLHPKQSHQQGDLGFRAGDWWINTLFAHHAGIIGLEAVEGGTTFDKHGAYALVLKDTGEIEAGSEERFTYRVPQADKGKYRLTAATRASREPIRVLRSHSINSIWGPKAGVRYEGLYSVSGWLIRQANEADLSGTSWKKGDVIFEVSFVRKEFEVPMEEVTKRPTTTEVDDYSEYKRLRKLYRGGKRKAHDSTVPGIASFEQLIKTAPQILPAPISSQKFTIRNSPTPSRKPTFKHPHFDTPEELTPEHSSLEMSPKSFSGADYFRFLPEKSSTLHVPARGSLRPGTQHSWDPSPSVTPDVSVHSGAVSITSSVNTGVSAPGGSPQANMHEVTPWMDVDAEISIPSSNDTAPSANKSDRKTATPSPRKPSRARRSPTSTPRHNGVSSAPPSSKSKDSRKSIFVRSRNPMAKRFDGAGSEDDGAFSNAMDETASSLRRKQQRSSSIRVHSPVPVRPLGLESGSPVMRRGAVYTDGSRDLRLKEASTMEDIGVAPSVFDDPFVDEVAAGAMTAMKGSLMDFISRPRAAAPSLTPSSARVLTTETTEQVNSFLAGDGEVAFTDPFVDWGSPEGRKRLEEDALANVAPDASC